MRKAIYTLMDSEDRKVAQKILKGLLPSEFREVADIPDKKIDADTDQHVYCVKLKGQEQDTGVWLTKSCFDRPF